MLQLIQTQLLCNIASAISAVVGATGQVTCGTGAPTSTPAASACVIYIDKTSTAIYYWDGAAWQLKV